MEKPEPENSKNGEHRELWDAVWEGRVKLAQIGTEVRIGVGIASAVLVLVIAQLLGV